MACLTMIDRMGWRQPTWAHLHGLIYTLLASLYIIGMKITLTRIPESVTEVDSSTSIMQILSLYIMQE